jgi:hypothetical protein
MIDVVTVSPPLKVELRRMFQINSFPISIIGRQIKNVVVFDIFVGMRKASG